MIVNGKRIKGLQAYKVKGRDEYLYAWHNTYHGGNVDVFATMQDHERLPCCHSVASEAYLMSDCYEQSFKKLPQDVQKHLTNYLKDE